MVGKALPDPVRNHAGEVDGNMAPAARAFPVDMEKGTERIALPQPSQKGDRIEGGRVKGLRSVGENLRF